jgi:hypothetical protein
MKNSILNYLICILLLGFAGMSSASEMSFVSAGLKSSSVTQGAAELGVMEVALGGRYLEKYDEESAAFYYGLLSMYTYDGDTAPSDSLGLTLGMGSRFYGSEFSPRIRPYMSVYGEFESSEYSNDSLSQTTSVTALNYGLTLGFRFDFYEVIFFELESNLFESSLMETKTVETGATKIESTAYELSFSSAKEAAIGAMTIAVGMEL